ncbi:MAG TPA: M23 family metallopeptidase [Blastocatellia bacterium]|nr:M23 family metallopeptidase [Blastocatellia bacterium]
MTILRAGINFIAALSLTSFITIGAASAQTQAAQSTASKQSTNQIVGLTEQKPSEQASAQQQTTQQQKPTAQPVTNEDQTVVIPPAPVVIKRSANAITVPAVTASDESRFEEQTATLSNVRVGSLFGYRRDPFTRRAKFHSGVDIKARWGDAVGASQAGVVQFVGWHNGYGNMVIVDHGGGVTTYYAHLSSFDVYEGDRVARGTIVGRAGSTGRATSPHLHYEVRIDGNPVNPFQTIALDPSSDYFKQTAPPAGAAKHTEIEAAPRLPGAK